MVNIVDKFDCNLYSAEGVVKRLLPLGFTRASIRKELLLSDGDPDIAVLRLLKQQEESEDPLSAEGRGGGWEEVTEGELDQEGEESKEREEKKLFTIGYVWVSVVHMSMKFLLPIILYSLGTGLLSL